MDNQTAVGAETVDLATLTPKQREKAERQLAQVEARRTPHAFVGKGKRCRLCAYTKGAAVHAEVNRNPNGEMKEETASEEFARQQSKRDPQSIAPQFSPRELIGLIESVVAHTVKQLPEGSAGRRPLIHQSIIDIMKAIGPIAKTHRYQGIEASDVFNFRLIDEMTAALQPLLIQNNVYATPRVIDSWREQAGTLSGGVLFITRVRVGFTLTSALDGSQADEGITEGEAHSLSQFATNAAQTMAYKQFIWMQFCVPVLNADDPENERDMAPVETVHSEPLSPAAEERQLDLLDGAAAPATTKGRGKKTKSVSTAPVEMRIVPSEPISRGSIAIISAQLRGKTGLSEDMVAAHFNKTDLSGLMQSQLKDVGDFINGWQPPQEGGE